MRNIYQFIACSIALVSIASLTGCEQALHDLQTSYLLEATAPVENDETWALVETQTDNQEYSKAIANCEMMAEKYPKSSVPQIYFSMVYYESGDLDKCLEACDRAIELDPNDSALFASRSEVLFEMGRADLAIEAVSDAIVLDDLDSDLLVDRGFFYERMGKFSEAAQDYRRALKLDPEHFWATNNYASILCMSPRAHDRNGDKAVELGKKLVQMAVWQHDDRAYTFAWDTLASALAEKEQFGQALRACQKALRTATEEETVDIEKRMAMYKKKKPARYPSKGSHSTSAALSN
jgi:tetratricopeptide (TPR) repeat protein